MQSIEQQFKGHAKRYNEIPKEADKHYIHIASSLVTLTIIKDNCCSHF